MGLLGALLLIGVALNASPAYPAELDPRVMLKNIGYDIPLDAGSLDQDTPLDAITLVADGRMIPLVNDDQLIFENVRASGALGHFKSWSRPTWLVWQRSKLFLLGFPFCRP